MEIRDFQLERYFARYEFRIPHHLSAADCETRSVVELLELAGVAPEELLELRLGYTESQGDPGLRAAIAEFYPRCTADDVVVATAAEEAIFVAMHALLRPGERVVVQTPCYQSLFDVARSIGCDVVGWPLVETEEGWQADLDALAELLTAETHLLVVNAPHNPTGHQPTRTERAELIALARERGVRLFSDEMYRGLAPTDELELAPAAAEDERALSLWGMSKTFGLPGLRTGWLVCRDRDVLDEIQRVKDFTTICGSAPSELLARVALSCADAIIGQQRELIAANARRMQHFVERYRDLMVWHAPQAGPVGLARLAEGSATEFCDRMREAADVLLVPSVVFDMADRYLRFGLGRAGFGAALEQLAAACDR